MAQKQILVIEDEPDIVELLTYNLQREGYAVRSFLTGDEGLEAVLNDPPDLVLLDLMLPGTNGLDICRRLKADDATRHVPIIMLTARDEEVDMVTGLEVGADDYVTKPFSPRVLMARIRALLRRREVSLQSDDGITHLGAMLIDEVKHSVKAEGKHVDLTPTEFALLTALARRPGWVFSRVQLIDMLRDGQHVITDRAIDVQIANLRKKLGKCGRYVETVRGVGYRITEMT